MSTHGDPYLARRCFAADIMDMLLWDVPLGTVGREVAVLLCRYARLHRSKPVQMGGVRPVRAGDLTQCYVDALEVDQSGLPWPFVPALAVRVTGSDAQVADLAERLVAAQAPEDRDAAKAWTTKKARTR